MSLKGLVSPEESGESGESDASADSGASGGKFKWVKSC